MRKINIDKTIREIFLRKFHRKELTDIQQAYSDGLEMAIQIIKDNIKEVEGGILKNNIAMVDVNDPKEAIFPLCVKPPFVVMLPRKSYIQWDESNKRLGFACDGVMEFLDKYNVKWLD